jgi:hypothetical protein
MALVMMVSAVEPQKESLDLLFVQGHGTGTIRRSSNTSASSRGASSAPTTQPSRSVALGQTGRSSWAENDTAVSLLMPDYLQTEIMSADYG